MKKVLAFALCTTTIWIMMSFQPATAGPNGPCSGRRFYIHRAMPAEEIRTRVKRLIRCATYRWPVAGGYPKALDVATCESGLWPWAYSNGNAGVFQQRLIYWTGRAEIYLRRAWFPHWWKVRDHGWFKARPNVLLSVRMARALGWSHWSCQ